MSEVQLCIKLEMLIKASLTSSITLFIVTSVLAQKSPENNDSLISADLLPSLTIVGQQTANQRPVTTFETPISNLDFDPRVDMQSRNMAEAQGDLSIRGGTFENTGIQVGSATLIDPQTGHYSTELPIAPEMLGEPKVLTGADNALSGFNSSVGTVSYSWSEITKRGSLTIGGGDHNLNFQRIHNAITGAYRDSEDWTWGAEIESSRSESDGTIPFGDHSFDRTSSRVQLLGPDSQTDFFAGYQDKFYGWPGMYTANTERKETEDYQTQLYYFNHMQSYGEGSTWEASLFHRIITDHYILKRDVPLWVMGSTQWAGYHEAEISGVAFSGNHFVNENLAINYHTQFASDQIDTYTEYNGTRYKGLDRGNFTSREYFKFSLLPEYKIDTSENEKFIIKAGATFDDTNRNSSKVSPIFRVTRQKINDDSYTETYLGYSGSSQVVGYTAIGGNDSGGLFRSNHSLDRETSKTIEFGHLIKKDGWKLDSNIFYRWDDDLTDWTYFSGDVNRTANPVDTKTFGFELVASKKWENFEAIASYSYLKKKEDYKKTDFVGSFYALNYPENRLTLGVIWDPIDSVQIRVDNEWRKQRKNAIRTGPDSAFNSHLAASYYPAKFNDLELFLAYDKPWDEEFQDIPGTPGRGDQFSFGLTYNW